MKEISYSVSVNACKLFEKPNKRSEMTSEGLFGENFKVLKTKGNWVFGELGEDNYRGWTEKKNLSHKINENHKVIVLKTVVKEKPDIKSNPIFVISMCSRIHVTKIINNWAKIKLNKNKYGFVPRNHIKSIDCKTTNWIGKSTQMIGMPYLWGGRGSMGIDCSGLIQIAFGACGFNFPRDTEEQLHFVKTRFFSTNKLSQNCILFWKGHVAFAENEQFIIHASASEMSVVRESAYLSIKKIENITKSKTLIFCLKNLL